ncbi:hypothetical protein GDO86_019827 [Hymenochirus boettgeri]|uniref:Lysosomal acid phosphatase n=1 Tax=Hymenochirus boettgeri TaxID=247094 RepID=A0A8T2IL74_9PIPI|nr:hypothetical protein GDO86_019827 [Hymenochirus boettgeri]
MADRSRRPSAHWSRIIPVLLGLVLVLTSPPATHSKQLRLVTMVYRHGDRSPVKGFPTDIHKESDWPQGFGQLTQVGMQQHWEFGQELRSRYKGFLSQSYNRHEVFVRSTDVDRTLMSAQANLAGLYPPEGAQIFNPNIPWQPIPVHTVPVSKDQLLKFPLSPCPMYLELQEETRHSDEYIETNRDNLEFLQMMASHAGLPDFSLETVWGLYDVLYCEQKHNFSLPSWASPEVLTRLRGLKDFSFRFLFGISQRVKKARLQGGVLVDQILKNMTLASQNATNGLKLIAYSSHDTTLGALQMALDVYNGKQTPYASCHIFELHEEDSGIFTVEMYFRNESGKKPYPLTLPGCNHSCPLNDFRHLLQPIIPQDWEKECQLPSKIGDTEVIVGLIICGIILLILVILLASILFRQKTRPSGYQYVSNVGEDQT